MTQSHSGENPEQQVTNFLTEKLTPEKKTEEFYDREKLKKQIFSLVSGDESHLRRRRQILQDHPQIGKLLVCTKPYSMILAICFDLSWPLFILICYVIGATVSHSIQVLVHEFTHFSGHSSITVNKAFAMFCNMGTGLPAAMSFMNYHSDHHNYLGETGKDTDLPTRIEAKIGKKHFIIKLAFLALFPFIYIARPLIIAPKKITLEEVANYLVVICSNMLIVKFLGVYVLLYMMLGGVLSIGTHPAAGHTLAEHFEFVEGLETYDYFGFWNFFNLNLGYHTEHHDFPNCPWYNLPKVRKIASEYYQRLPYHTSYVMVYWKFLFDPNFNLYNRTLRKVEEQKKQN